jgi:hypothetical protein
LYPQSSVLSATIEILSALVFESCDAPGAIIRCSALLFDFLRWNSMPLPSTLVAAKQPRVFLLSTFSIEIKEEKFGDDLHEEVRVGR